MCIAIYKPADADFPSKSRLKTCFENNPDGAGFMYAAADRVHIRKGFKTFSDFWKDLRTIREKTTDRADYVLHFRISTQAGTRPDCTHPFPLSRDMSALRALRHTCDIGIAHNGIISLTSHGWNKTITHSDTMEFITEYAARLIKSREWYTDPDLVAVITAMVDSRLAVLDGSGHCTLIGDGWTEDGGVWYSNTSYNPRPVVHETPYYGKNESWYYPPYHASGETKTSDIYGDFFDSESGLYYFDSFDCPATDGDSSYCAHCAFRDECWGGDER